jgi:hypothetical protein
VSAVLVLTDNAALCHNPDVNSMSVTFVQFQGFYEIIDPLALELNAVICT